MSENMIDFTGKLYIFRLLATENSETGESDSRGTYVVFFGCRPVALNRGRNWKLISRGGRGLIPQNPPQIRPCSQRLFSAFYNVLVALSGGLGVRQVSRLT